MFILFLLLLYPLFIFNLLIYFNIYYIKWYIREDIANCSEKSFKTLSLKDAEKVLLFNDNNQFQQYIKERNWKVQGDVIQFGNNDNQTVEIPSLQLIHQTLHYAKELERIV